MKKNIKFVQIIISFLVLLSIYNPSFVYAAASGDGGMNKTNLYKQGKQFVLKAKKLEKKGKTERALKLYS